MCLLVDVVLRVRRVVVTDAPESSAASGLVYPLPGPATNVVSGMKRKMEQSIYLIFSDC